MLALAGCSAAPSGEPPTSCSNAEQIQVPTDDGGAVALHHHPGPGPPVIVVHGISSNHHCWDLAPDRSLAVALVEAGYDAWLLDLRGHGDARFDARGEPQRGGWTIDDYGRYDVPAAIEAVRAATGAHKVGYVGHSMGGMVAAVYTALYGDDALAALVVVASPVEFSDPDPLLALGGASMTAGTVLGRVHTPMMADLAALMRHAPFRFDDILFSSDNLSPAARRLMYQQVVSPLTRGELRQFSGILQQGRFTSEDGSIDYLDALSRLRTPLLTIAGRADQVATADRVRPWVERAGSAEKRFVLAGRVNGFLHDYGHLDLTVGDDAAEEIYPLITGWFEGRWP